MNNYDTYGLPYEITKEEFKKLLNSLNIEIVKEGPNTIEHKMHGAIGGTREVTFWYPKFKNTWHDAV